MNKLNIFSIYIFILGGVGCGIFQEKPGVTPDSVVRVWAENETVPVPAATGADAADDPAIWVHPTVPEKSLIIGTVKHFGLEVYDLYGRLKYSYRTGNPNNVDLRKGFRLNDGTVIDFAACSDRAANEVALFRIDPESGALREIKPRIKSALAEVYGICLYKSAVTGDFYVFINGKDGSMEQFKLMPIGSDGIAGTLVRTFKVNSQPEGLVADDRLGVVYLGEEDLGIWKLRAEPTESKELTFLEESTPASGRPIQYDIEGLAIYPTGDTTGYLIASSQGNNTYALFERSGRNRYVGSFAVGSHPSIRLDGSEETDGLDVTALPLSGPYSKGMLVVQDGFNKTPEGKATSQNFKMIRWSLVDSLIFRKGQ